ncbi:YdcF family protein [Neisseria sp.]|uniref:YdcF family protein n=1 Tax=Neisseria sp. TaxID=192066 RepID=UPI0026DD40C0|nr:YdcF family protein [Neisseria sp.]
MKQLFRADVAMVLGYPVNRGSCLNSRVMAGVTLYREGKVPLLLMSGGMDCDGSNQAEAMCSWAGLAGVPEKHILLENQSSNTYLNLKLSASLLEGKQSIILVSSAYHLPRARWMAKCQYPEKTVQVYAERQTESFISMLPELMKETLSWVKALWLEYGHKTGG